MTSLLEQENAKHSFEFYEEFFENFTSENTRSNYKLDISQFLEWIEYYFQLKTYEEIERIHVIKYRNFLSEAGGRGGSPCAPKTIGRKLASLSSYFHFLVEKGVAKYNPVTSVKRPRTEVVTPTNALNGEQVRQMFDAIDENKNSGALHMALLMVFFTTGLRKSEILNLKFKNYKKIGPNFILEYRGKGGKLGQKLLHPEGVEALDRYIEWMKENDREHDLNDWLFQPTVNPSDPTNLNKPLNPKTINETLNRYAKKIGLNFTICPHSARATFISELLDVGVDIYSVAQEVNHSSVKTTQEYDKRRKKLSDSPVTKIKY